MVPSVFFLSFLENGKPLALQCKQVVHEHGRALFTFEEAGGLKITERRLVAQVALAVGAGVAISGTVGFVGLIAPHIVRLLLGPAHRTLLPAAAAVLLELHGSALAVSGDACPEG